MHRYNKLLAPGMLAVLLASAHSLALAQVGSLRVTSPSGTEVGTAFLVSDQGYLATSFRLMQRATGGTLELPNRTSFRLAGWVAASKASDVVILAVDRAPPNLRAPAFAVNNALVPGTVIGPTPGPLSQPLMQQLAVVMPGEARSWNQRLPATAGLAQATSHFEFYAPKLRRALSGADLMAGFPDLAADAPGRGLQTKWLMLDMSFEPSYLGAPLWDNQFRNIYGMVAGPPGEDQRHRLGVSIEHVLELVPKTKVKGQPFTALRKYQDAPRASAGVPALGAAESEARGTGLADRFVACIGKAVEYEKLISEQQQSMAKQKAIAVDFRAKIDVLDTELRTMRPEEKHTEEYEEWEEKEVPSKSGKKGETKTVKTKVRKTRTTYRFSARQLAEQRRLSVVIGQHTASFLTAMTTENSLRTFEVPHTTRSLDRLRGELLYFGDPYQLRCVEEHQALLTKLDEQIADGGAPGMLYLVRGLCKLRLKRLEEAQADFKDAVEVDGKLRRLADVAEGRRLILAGETEKGLTLINKTVNMGKKDPWIETLYVRVQIDRNDFAGASRTVTALIRDQPLSVENQMALAWLSSTAPTGTNNPRAALTSAQQACELTSNTDWLCLAALAAAHARSGDFAESQTTLEQAEPLAPEDYRAQFTAWMASVAEMKPLERDWN